VFWVKKVWLFSSIFGHFQWCLLKLVCAPEANFFVQKSAE
jgi:hypothetical protein